MNRDHSFVFEIAAKYCISNYFVDYESYSISSKWFLPIVVDIAVIWIKFVPVHFSPLIPKMSMFALAISCLTIFNLPWFMNLTFQVPMQYFSLQHWTLFLSQVTPTTGCCFHFFSASSFFLELFICSSPVTFWHLLTWGFIFQCPIFLPFHAVHEVLKARMLKWFAIPFSSGPRFVRTLQCELSILGDPTYMAPSFIELHKTVFHVIILFSFQWLWFSFYLLSDRWG